MKVDRILVPLDGSEMAEAAIRDALQIARPDSTLLLVRAAQGRVLPGATPLEDILAVNEADGYLTALKASLEKGGCRSAIQMHVWYGAPASVIVEAARVNRADVIVMSTHGRSGLGRLVFGSVAESVLRGTTVPILLVRPAEAPLEQPSGQNEARPAATPSVTRTGASR